MTLVNKNSIMFKEHLFCPKYVILNRVAHSETVINDSLNAKVLVFF